MYYGWRGIVGMVKPTFRPGSMEDFIKLMPDGVGVMPLRVGAREGTQQEFVNALDIVKERVAELAALHVDVIVVSGAPLTIVHGLDGDARISRELEEAHGIPVTTSARNLLDAFHAMHLGSTVIATYTNDDAVNDQIAGFYNDGGVKVRAIEKLDVPFANAGRIPPPEIYALAKKAFLKAGGADSIFLFGAGWRTLPIIEMLEQDLGTKVVTNVPAEVWATFKLLHIHSPIQGYGTLLRELP
jgi:maleate isomerase